MTKEERNALLYKPQNGLDRISAVEEAEMNDYCEQVLQFCHFPASLIVSNAANAVSTQPR